MRFPVASPKMALYHERGTRFYGVTRSANGSKRRTRNTNDVLRTVNVHTLETWLTVRARLTGKFPGSPVELDPSSNLSTTRLFHWRFDHDDDIPFPSSGDEFRASGFW